MSLLSTHIALSRASRLSASARAGDAGFSPLTGARRALIAALAFAVPTGVWCVVAAGAPGALCAAVALAVVAVHYLLGLPFEMAALRRADAIGFGLILVSYVVRLGLLAAMLWLVSMWGKGLVDTRALALCVVLPTVGWLVGLTWNALHDRTPTVQTHDDESEVRA